MTRKLTAFLILLTVQIETTMAATPGCSDRFADLSVNVKDLPPVSPEMAAEIRRAYSQYLKDVGPDEQKKVITLIAAAERNNTRSKVQKTLTAAMERCSGARQ